MKYFKTYEAFKKDYMKKIDLKDFKKIKKGSKIMYMGGEAEVLDNNGFVLKLKGEDGKTFTVNKSMFDHGGMINEGLDLVEQIIFMIILAANVVDGSISKPIIKYFKNRKEIKKIVKRVSTNKDLVAAAKSKDDSKFYELLRDTLTDDEFDTLFKVGANYDKVQRGVARESINEASSEKDGTEASDGKHKHEDHLEEDMESMWKKAYGENFASKYPGVAKIIKQRKIKDPREIARIWQETYGEDFKEEYPAIWDMLSK